MFLPSLLVTLSQGGGLRLSSTARVGRGPSQGARSASTEDIGGRPPSLPSKLARSILSRTVVTAAAGIRALLRFLP